MNEQPISEKERRVVEEACSLIDMNINQKKGSFVSLQPLAQAVSDLLLARSRTEIEARTKCSTCGGMVIEDESTPPPSQPLTEARTNESSTEDRVGYLRRDVEDLRTARELLDDRVTKLESYAPFSVREWKAVLGELQRRLAALESAASPRPSKPEGEARPIMQLTQERVREIADRQIALRACDDHEILQGFEERIAKLEHRLNDVLGMTVRLESPRVQPEVERAKDAVIEAARETMDSIFSKPGARAANIFSGKLELALDRLAAAEQGEGKVE